MNSRRVATTPYAVAHRAVLRADVRQNARQCAPGDAAHTPQRDSLQVFPRRLRLQLGLRLRRRLGMSLQVSACKGEKPWGFFFWKIFRARTSPAVAVLGRSRARPSS